MQQRAVPPITMRVQIGGMLGAAILGKLLSIYFAGRVSGIDPYRSWVLGTLVNTLALIGLIVLNIGFDGGFIPQKVFAMMVGHGPRDHDHDVALLRVMLPRAGHELPVGVEA